MTKDEKDKKDKKEKKEKKDKTKGRFKINQHWLVFGLLLLIGAFLRVLWIVHVPTTQMYDFQTYQELAVNIANGQGYTLGGYPVAWQGMLYSFGLGILYKIMGNSSEMIPKFLNVIMSEATIVFVFLIMKRIYNKPWAVWISVLLMTFMPNQIVYCNVIGTEIITAFFLSLTILLSLINMKVRFKYPLLGLMCALLSLSKPFYLAYPLVLAVIEYLKHHKLKAALIQFASVYVIMMLVILPWSLRNLEKYGRWIPVSYNSGFNLYINNNAQNVHGGWMDYHLIEKSEALENQIKAEVSAHGESVKTSPNLEVFLKPYAMDYIKAHPIEFIKLGIIRTHATYFNGTWDIGAWTMNEVDFETAGFTEDPFIYSRTMNAFRAISDIILYIISSFGIVYVFMNIFRICRGLIFKTHAIESFIAIPVINLAFVSLVFFVYEGQPRYNFIVLFLLIMTFAIGFDVIRERFHTSEGNHLQKSA